MNSDLKSIQDLPLFLLNYNDQSIKTLIYNEKDKICFVANYTKESTSHLSVAKLTLLVYQGEREREQEIVAKLVLYQPTLSQVLAIASLMSTWAHNHSLAHIETNFALPGGHQDKCNVFLVLNFIRKKYHKFHTQEKRMILSLSYKEKN